MLNPREAKGNKRGGPSALPASPFTGERFVPGAVGGELADEHVQRYRAACPLIADKIVLDAACGEGFGSNMLADFAREVHGIDISEKTVQEAQIHYRRDNLSFQCASVAQLPFPDERFDAVVSFETIEHINADTQEQFLQEIKRTLKKNGILIISTPEKHAYSVVTGQINPFHVREFFYDEFRIFLSRYFKHIGLFRQGWQKDNSILSLVPDESGPGTSDVAARISLDEQMQWPCLFMVAICSDGPIPALQAEIMVSSIDSSIFVDDGSGYREENRQAVRMDRDLSANTFSVEFRLPSGGGAGRKVRWDPCEGRFCRCRIEKVETDGVWREATGLGARKGADGWDEFLTGDPAYEMAGDWSVATYLRISGGFALPGAEAVAGLFGRELAEVRRECEREASAVDSSIFIDDGSGYGEENKAVVRMDFEPSTSAFSAEFRLPPGGSARRKLRWDPCEGRFCRCRIGKVETDGIYRGIGRRNAWKTENGLDEFMTGDPIYELDGDWTKATFIRISGEFILPGADAVADRFQDEIAAARRECEALRQEVLRVETALDAARRECEVRRQELDQIQTSRSWRWTRFLRRLDAWLAGLSARSGEQKP